MNGMRFLNQTKRVLKPALEHWAWLSAAALLLFAVFVWWTGMTWIPSLLVAVIALAGYGASHQQYREQEARKYRPAIVATFSVPVVEKREGAQGWIPGFVYKFEKSDPALDADFTLQNISESPVTDVRMNFYLHNYERPETPQSFFEEDIVVVDGLAGKSRARFVQTLRSHRIRPANNPTLSQSSGGAVVLAFSFSQLLLSLIPSARREKPARLSAWSLVLKYKNLLGEPFFCVYKVEAPARLEESWRMAFHGSFAGDYLVDDKNHGFVENRGFVSKEKAPDWEGIQSAVKESMQQMATFHSGADNYQPPC